MDVPYTVPGTYFGNTGCKIESGGELTEDNRGMFTGSVVFSVKPGNWADMPGIAPPKTASRLGVPATPVTLLAHLRCAFLFMASSGGVARASLTPGYKLPSLRDEQ